MSVFKDPQRRKLFFAKLATFWIPLKPYRQAARCIMLMGVRKWRAVIKAESTRKFKYKLAVGAIMKNEGPYLKEWLDYHILVGVEKFYLYNNGSTDNTADVVAPYVASGVVELIDFPGPARQAAANADAVRRAADEARWLAIIDLDEFLVPVKHRTITEFLETLPRNFWSVVVTWVCYGSSGHVKKPDGLVMENYRRHETKFHGVKSIINPRLAIQIRNPHVNVGAGFIVDERGRKMWHIDQTRNPPSCNIIRCNHYVTKSYEEYCARHAQGPADGNPNYKTYRSPERFAAQDTNDVYDDIMDKYIVQLKSKNKKAK